MQKTAKSNEEITTPFRRNNVRMTDYQELLLLILWNSSKQRSCKLTLHFLHIFLEFFLHRAHLDCFSAGNRKWFVLSKWIPGRTLFSTGFVAAGRPGKQQVYHTCVDKTALRVW